MWLRVSEARAGGQGVRGMLAEGRVCPWWTQVTWGLADSLSSPCPGACWHVRLLQVGMEN